MKTSHPQIPAEHTKLHYSTKFMKAYYRYIIANFDASIFDQACEHFRMDKNYLLSDNNWISHDFLKNFRDYLKTATGDELLSYHIGKSFLTSENINPFEKAILKALPPSLFFKIFSFNTKKLNKVSEYKVRKNSWGRVTIELISVGKHVHNKDICMNAIGIFESFEQALGLNRVTVKHTECIHRDGKTCLFDFKYSARTQWLRRLSGIGIMSLLGAFAWWSADYLPLHKTMLQWVMACMVLGYSLFAFLAYVTFEMFKTHFVHVQQTVNKNAEINQKRERLEFRDHESVILRDMSLKLNEGLSPNEIITRSTAELGKQFGFSRAIVMLHNPLNNCLFTKELVGFELQKERDILLNLRLKYPNSNADKKELFANILEQGEVKLIKDLRHFSSQLENSENQYLINLLKVNSLIVAPIGDDKNKFGLLVIGSFGDERTLDEYDRELVVKVAQLISVAFKNSRTLENQKQLAELFKKYVPAMVLDNLTSGAVSPLGHATSSHIVSFFCDLRDFTQTSQTLKPEQVKIMLDIYIDFITEKIAKFGGVIDKILGDGINAFFPREGTAIVDSDYINRAFLTAVEIISNLDTLSKRFEERGFPTPRVGIGLNAGTAFVGSFGSALKMDYSAIGDTVNLAARLQGMAKDLSQEVFKKDKSLLVVSSSVSEFLAFNYRSAATLEKVIRGRTGTVIVSVYDEETLKSQGPFTHKITA